MTAMEQKPLDSLRVLSLQDSVTVLPIMYEDMKQALSEKDPDHTLGDVLQEKHKDVVSGALKGVVIYDNDQPVAMGWLEILGAYYGSVLLHAIQPGYESAVATAMTQTGLLDVYLFELMALVPSDVYGQTLTELGMSCSHRTRMGLWLSEKSGVYFEDPDITFEPLTEDKIHVSSEISLAAHEVSKDQLLSRDLSIPENRVNLERKVVTGKFGKTIQEATLIMSFMNEPIGFITMVEIACWGRTDVPWIFDISLLPAYHGKGFGKRLIQKAMHELAQLDYELMGLSVTNSNTSAIALYENQGFFKADEFVEYAFPF